MYATQWATYRRTYSSVREASWENYLQEKKVKESERLKDGQH